MKTQIFKHAAFAAAFAATFFFTACEKTDHEAAVSPATEQTGDPVVAGEITGRANGNSKVFPPTAHPYGKSYAEWTEVWVQQFYMADCENIPFFVSPDPLFYAGGPVYIMAGITGEGNSANVTIPHGKAVLFPLANFWADICPDELPAGMTEEEYLNELIEGALPLIDESSLLLTIDGDEVNNLGAYKVVSDLFSFTGNPVLAECFDPCVTGEPQPGITGGYYVILKPLSKGQHTVYYHSEVPAFEFVQDATYNITVE